MLTTLLVNRLLVNIAYMEIWVYLTFVLVHLRKNVGAPVQKVSLEPCIMRYRPGMLAGQPSTVISWSVNHLEMILALWAGAKENQHLH